MCQTLLLFLLHLFIGWGSIQVGLIGIRLLVMAHLIYVQALWVKKNPTAKNAFHIVYRILVRSQVMVVVIKATQPVLYGILVMEGITMNYPHQPKVAQAIYTFHL